MLLVLCLVGLGGYQLGRQPNSRDIVGELKGKAAQVDWQGVGQKAGDAYNVARQKLSDWSQSRQQPSAPEPTDDPAPVGGTSASATRTVQNWPPPQQDFPQCW